MEVVEAIRVLRGEVDNPCSLRFRELCVRLAGLTLTAAGVASDEGAGERLALAALEDGTAMAKGRAWFRSQGALDDVFEDVRLLPTAPVRRELRHQGPPGWLARLDAGIVGAAVVALGGGRQKKEDGIDHAVGIEVFARVGDPIEKGSPILVIHAADEASAEAAERMLRPGIQVGTTELPATLLIHTTL